MIYRIQKHVLPIFFATLVTIVVIALFIMIIAPPVVNPNFAESKNLFHKGNSNVAVLLLHGLTATPSEVRPLFDKLSAQDITVVAPVLIGHGTHPRDLKTVTWKNWTTQAKEEYDSLKRTHKKVYVAGISLGAAISLELASQEDNLSGVITIGAPIVLRNKKTYLSTLLSSIVPYVAHPVEKEEKLTYYQSVPPSAITELLSLIEELKSNLKNVKAPLLMFQGTADPTVEFSSGQYILDHVSSPKRTLKLIDAKSHILIDDPKRAEIIYNEIYKFMNLDNLSKEKKVRN